MYVHRLLYLFCFSIDDLSVMSVAGFVCKFWLVFIYI
jgi:hypothetical protein